MPPEGAHERTSSPCAEEDRRKHRRVGSTPPPPIAVDNHVAGVSAAEDLLGEGDIFEEELDAFGEESDVFAPDAPDIFADELDVFAPDAPDIFADEPDFAPPPDDDAYHTPESSVSGRCTGSLPAKDQASASGSGAHTDEATSQSRRLPRTPSPADHVSGSAGMGVEVQSTDHPAVHDDVLEDAMAALQLEEAQRGLEERLEAAAGRSQRRVRTRGRLGRNTVNRFRLVEDTLKLARSLDAKGIVAPLVTSFTGAAELGVDSGGLSSELLTAFLDEAFTADAGFFEPVQETRLSTSTLLMPVPLDRSSRPPEDFSALGTLLLKAKIDSVPLPGSVFPLAFWKMVRDATRSGEDAIGLPDLAEIEPSLADRLSTFLSLPADQVEAWSVFTSTPGERLVTCDLREEYVEGVVADKLVAGREGSVDAIRRGMSVAPELFEATCGKQLAPAVTASMFSSRPLVPSVVLDAMVFAPDMRAPSSSLEQWVREIVEQSFSPDDLGRLLQLLTGVRGIPVGGLRNPDASPPHKIRLSGCDCTCCRQAKRGKATEGCDGWLAISTCFWTCRLPLYPTKEVLASRLHKAMTWASGFGSE